MEPDTAAEPAPIEVPADVQAEAPAEAPAPWFVDGFDDPSAWTVVAPTDGDPPQRPAGPDSRWRVADGVLRLEVDADTGTFLAPTRSLPVATGWLRITARARTDALDDPEDTRTGGLTLTVAPSGTSMWVGHDFAPTAADGWAEIGGVVLVPPDATGLELGARLVVPGVAEIDDLRVEVIGVETQTITIPAAEAPPSALDAVDADGFRGRARAEGDLDEGVGEDGLPELPSIRIRNLVRGKFGVRPILAVAVHPGEDRTSAALRAGAALNHRYWTVAPTTIQLGGETSLRASAPAGGARGYRFDLVTAHGPWFGPVGVRLGPAVRVDREVWGGDVLPTALSVGGTLDLAFDLGDVGLWAGFVPLWAVTGDRVGGEVPPASLGSETTWRGGASVAFGRFDLSAEAAVRSTAVGAFVDTSLGLGVRFP